MEGAVLVDGVVEGGTVVGADGLELTGTVGSPPPHATNKAAADNAQTWRKPCIKYAEELKPCTRHLSISSHDA